MIVIFILTTILLIACFVFIYQRKEEKHQEEIEELENTISSQKHTIEEYETTITIKKDNIDKDNKEIDSLKNQIKELKEKLSSTIQENNSNIDNLTMQLSIKDQLLIKEQKKYIEASNKLKEKENKRIASAGTISSKQKKIENLEKKINELKELHKQELEKKDITIEFYKSKLPEPSLKELKDYKYKRKKSSDKYV